MPFFSSPLRESLPSSPVSDQPEPGSRSRRRASRLAVLIVCLPLLFLSACAWPMYRQGARRTGWSGIDTSKNTGTVKTCFNPGIGQNQYPFGPILGYTAISGGIFLGDLGGNLYSVNTNCTLAWQVPTGGIGATPNAVGLNGDVYVNQSGGSIFTISSSGVPQWSFSPPGGMSRGELAVGNDGTIYGGSNCGVLYALNPNGSLKWKYTQFQTDCPGKFTPIVSPAVAGAPIGAVATIYSGVPGVLFAVSAAGTPVWHSFTYTGTPAVAPNNNIYVLSPDGNTMFALNSSGVLQWQISAPFAPLGQSSFTLPAIAPDSSFYVGTAFSGVWHYDSAGNPLWQATPNGYMSFFSPPSIAGDGTIYASSSCTSVCGAAQLFALNPNSTLKWSATLCQGQTTATAFFDEPVIGFDGTIYMIVDDNSNFNATCPLETIT